MKREDAIEARIKSNKNDYESWNMIDIALSPDVRECFDDVSSGTFGLGKVRKILPY